MNYEEWLKTVPKEIAAEVLWSVKAYRYPLFASDLCWFGEAVVLHRLAFLTEIVRLLITMISQQRKEGTIREPQEMYEVGIDSLLVDVPLP